MKPQFNLHLPRKLTNSLAAIFLVCSFGCSTTPAKLMQRDPASIGESKTGCGSPMIESRVTAVFGAPTAETPPNRASIELISKSNLAEFRFYLGQLNQTERDLLSLANKFPPFVVTRLPFSRLRTIFVAQGILSAKEAMRRGLIKAEQLVTPGIEEELYNARDCVFAAVGSPTGQKRYGDVIVTLNSSIANQGWATPQSGFGFLRDVRKMEVRGDIKAGFDERIHMSHLISSGDHWSEYMGLALVKELRKKDPAGREAIERKLLEAKNAKEFWKRAYDNSVGFLEAKFDAKILLEWIESIEVPSDKRDEVLQWAEAKPWLDRIK